MSSEAKTQTDQPLKPTTVGGWIDGGFPSYGKMDGWAAEIADVLDFAIIVTNPLSKLPYYSPVPTQKKLAEQTKALQNLGVKVGWMWWPYAASPDIARLKTIVKEYIEYAASVDAIPHSHNLDLEGAGKGWGASGARLSQELVDAFLDQPHPIEVSVTSINPINGLRRQDEEVMRSLMKSQGFCTWMPQLYSQYQPSKDWTHADFFRPGPVQRHGIQRIAELKEKGTISGAIGGGMLGFQDHPRGPKGEDALDYAAYTLLEGGVTDLVYWSWKWAGSDNRKWIQRLKQDGVASPDDAPAANDSTEIIKGVQRALTIAGYSPGPIDGLYGARTKYAVEAFEKENNLRRDGIVDIEVLRRLLVIATRG